MKQTPAGTTSNRTKEKTWTASHLSWTIIEEINTRKTYKCKIPNGFPFSLSVLLYTKCAIYNFWLDYKKDEQMIKL